MGSDDKGEHMTEEERELDLEVADLRHENRVLKAQLENAVEEALHLRHKIEHIYALASLALQDRRVKEHDDKDSY